jgi:ADP-ribose pyrophosphatase YjhB (NUDIX family)
VPASDSAASSLAAEAAWYAGLPTMFGSAAALLTDPKGRALLVKPNYREHWSLPGGIMEHGEPPHVGCRREVTEELGLDIAPGRLLAIDWSPPDGVRPRAIVHFVFDGRLGTTRPLPAHTIRRVRTRAGCVEPVNFAFIQRDGVPTGPPSPQNADLATFVNNDATLLMNPGDTITVHMSDAPAPGGGDAFEVVIRDISTGQTGFMQASAQNGFETTSAANCSGTPFNFQPEYNTAAKANIIPWAALATNISTEFETGHMEVCTSLSNPLPNFFDGLDTGGNYGQCNGPYENAGPADSTTPETSDTMCYPAGDTHPGYAGPGTSTAAVQVDNCQDNVFQNGDLDFDGTPYWTEWPTGLIPGLHPSSFLEKSPPRTGGSTRSTSSRPTSP